MSELSRRSFLAYSCSAAAVPLSTQLVHATAPGENRLVILILRGAMDGLGVLIPQGDPNLRRMRPGISRDTEQPIELDSLYGLTPFLSPLWPMWRSGELAFAQAVSTPYRDKRSHFDGQHILEGGSTQLLSDGWLNRSVRALGVQQQTYAVSIGRETDLVMRGAAPFTSWNTDTDINISADEIGRLKMLYGQTPEFRATFEKALAIDAIVEGQNAEQDAATAASVAAKILRKDGRLVSFSLLGWDTHVRQARTIRRPMSALSNAITTLKSDLGPDIWSKTTVLAMTEFGRTVRENGSFGTDHGTGSMLLMAGGAVNGGKVYGRWPGLSEAQLYNNRDLMPTSDIRVYPAWALSRLFNVPRMAIETQIFPGLDMGYDPGYIRG